MTVSATVPYPAGIDPARLDQFARALDAAAHRFDGVDAEIAAVGAVALRSWQGEAAVTFADHMADRAHTFDLAARQAARAAVVLREYAAALRANHEAYLRAAQYERSMRITGLPRPELVAVAVAEQRRIVGDVERLGARFGAALTTVAGYLCQYADRSFTPVGEHMDVVRGPEGLTGRFLLADALDATEDGRIGTDEIQIRRLSDGTYVVILPGVTDLSNGTMFRNGENTARKVLNAGPTAWGDGTNPYAEMVKMALQRAGVPDGATVTFVGHSYGAYTSMDLALDEDFNRADGRGVGYGVNVKRVIAAGADTDWKVPKVPGQTDVLVLNNRDDVVYQAEAQANPESDWLWRRDRLPGRLLRPRLPGFPLVSLPLPSDVVPTTSYPSGRSNQVEYELDAGRRFDGDDRGSGHHPSNYSPVIRSASVRSPIRPILDGTGDAQVLERYNVRIPDRVPQVPTGPRR